MVKTGTIARVSYRALSLAAAATLDLAFGEPPASWHPVVLAGRALALGTDRHKRSGQSAQLIGGAAALIATAGAAAVVGAVVDRRAGRSATGLLVRAAALKPLFAVRMLLAEASVVATALEDGDLDGARERLRSLVSRPTGALGPGLVAAAAIESLAENLGDSVVAPWLYYSGFSLPGAAVYRVINTADSMYGYHGENEWLGKAAARTDDILSWLPSRIAAGAIVAAARVRLGPDAATAGVATWRRDARVTESSNAGNPMAVMAGALQRRLEKRDHYVLGAEFAEPDASDLRRAIDLTATAAGLTLAGFTAALVFGRR